MSEMQELIDLHRQTRERVLTLQKHLRLAATEDKKKQIAKDLKETKRRLAELEEAKNKLGL